MSNPRLGGRGNSRVTRTSKYWVFAECRPACPGLGPPPPMEEEVLITTLQTGDEGLERQSLLLFNILYFQMQMFCDTASGSGDFWIKIQAEVREGKRRENENVKRRAKYLKEGAGKCLTRGAGVGRAGLWQIYYGQVETIHVKSNSLQSSWQFNS